MKTVWGEHLNSDAVLQEYPRPQLVRESYINLNGYWDYAITKKGDRPDTWDGRILVPFSPEAELSGVNRMLLPGEFLWYRRTLLVSELFAGKRLLLHIGACDQRAKVFCNGQYVMAHTGGYTAFTADLTSFLHAGENDLTIQVRDDLEASQLSRGKQSSKRGGIWYTPQSGIWQTVWCEWVPENYVKAIRYTPDLITNTLYYQVQAKDPAGAHVALSLHGEAVAESTSDEKGFGALEIPPDALRLWSPETPALYDVSATLGEDHVTSYAAMRSIGVGEDEDGVPRLLLNGKPYFQNGVLDQGYFPDGLYTAPSDDALVFDIQLMKDMGFNMLRKHIKIEPMRWYYHCDRLGMLVWQDMLNGGGKYHLLTISAPLVTGIHHKDHDYRKFSRTDAIARASYYTELTEMLAQLYSCPCICTWVAFNEGWGQFDAAAAADYIKKLDPTRIVDHASGWHDQKVGNLQSLHVYFRPYRFRPDKLHRAVALTEFGGYTLAVPGHTWGEKRFGYKGFSDAESLGAAFRKLYQEQIVPAKEKGLSACVYTQLSDVEDELNGFVTYDRKTVKLPKALVREVSLSLR